VHRGGRKALGDGMFESISRIALYVTLTISAASSVLGLVLAFGALIRWWRAPIEDPMPRW
jgi:hypothetical protein